MLYTVGKVLSCRFRICSGIMHLENVFMVKINDFPPKMGVFRESMEIKSAGTLQKWAIFCPKLAFNQVFFLNRPQLSNLFALTTQNLHNLPNWGSVNLLFSNLNIGFFVISLFVGKLRHLETLMTNTLNYLFTHLGSFWCSEEKL